MIVLLWILKLAYVLVTAAATALGGHKMLVCTNNSTGNRKDFFYIGAGILFFGIGAINMLLHLAYAKLAELLGAPAGDYFLPTHIVSVVIAVFMLGLYGLCWDGGETDRKAEANRR